MDEKRLIEKINELPDTASIGYIDNDRHFLCTAAELKAALGEAKWLEGLDAAWNQCRSYWDAAGEPSDWNSFADGWNAALAAPPAREWVATADRLPTIEGQANAKYLITVRDSLLKAERVGEAYRVGGVWYWVTDNRAEDEFCEVTAWCEMPQPFTGGAN